MRKLAPIVYFLYNRPLHTKRTLEALSKNEFAQESSLWIFIDGPKEDATDEDKRNIEEVKAIAKEKKWCGEVHIAESSGNKGLVKSIVGGITEIVNKFGKVIVIEDDILVSPGFLTYMNDALDFYENNPKVMHISGFSRPEFKNLNIKEPTYFFYHTTCWGWATWKNAWDLYISDPLDAKQRVKAKGSINKLNMDGTFEVFWSLKSSSKGKFQDWNYNWHCAVFLNNGLCLHPAKSLVANIGHDGSGTNCMATNDFSDNEELVSNVAVTPIPLEENKTVRNFYKNMYSFQYKTIFTLKHYLRYLVH